MALIRRNGPWLLTLVAGLCLGAGAVSFSQAVQPGSEPEAPQELSVAFRGVARDVLPAVVSIETRTNARKLAAEPGDSEDQEFGAPGDDLFRRFFGNDPRFREFLDQMPRELPPTEGRGSGFIIREDGVILTNSHVVEGADRVIVHLHDGNQVQAESWVYDPRSDVAVIRIKSDTPLPTVPLGNSDEAEIGDWVLAMGNPFDVGVTVTAGIISAKMRGPGINERENYLQTDAAINPGNSGGPLINMRGEVVGINTAISTRSGGYDGVGFAIPVNMVRWVSDQLIADGRVRRAYLGVQLQYLDYELRQGLNVPVGRGALVVDVMPGTPAAKAGFEVGDVVLEFNGKPIANRSELQDTVEALEIGQTYEAVVLRDGEETSIDVTLEEMPSDFTPALRRGLKDDESAPPARENAMFDELGLQVSEPDETLTEKYGLEADVEGVVVTSVKAGSPAAERGIEPGDVIEKVGGTAVSTVEEFRSAVEKRSLESGVVLLIRRGAASQFIVLKAE
ncbi:MAG: Do family serine endopeptidase [Planctomycetota bacterium]|nr:MAG: Do family serine endopeptidase [Planctomycetota bacterium]REJ90999.1 MAG: Do family serine endopeptidase [Planctomycetota bacterium]REK31042.1 MAG: Do family serine endopeptidase [Planctomycetota bacterium]REK36842.1 MAG: Do family serine endopeptidase [Planctomycetota bacterium]